MKKTFISLLPFFLLSLAAGWLAGRLMGWPGRDHLLLMIANAILFLSGWLILSMQKKALEGGNPHAFVRSVMGGIGLKMAIFLTFVIIYAISAAKEINNWLVFCSILLYLVYLVVEVAYLMKLNKK